MSLKEFEEKYIINNDLDIRVETFAKYNEVMSYLEELGYTWTSGNKLTKKSMWFHFGNETTIWVAKDSKTVVVGRVNLENPSSFINYELVTTEKELLANETQEIAAKLNGLNEYMKTSEFYNLDRVEKDLIYEQSRALNTLVQILGKRCELHEVELM